MSINLVWIVVKDFQKAIQFYTEVMGLRLVERHDQWGWAELQGDTGARLGIAVESGHEITAGNNGVITLTVDDIEVARDRMIKRGVTLVGDIQDIPGHVRMQLCRDADGNYFQFAQTFPS